jgi:HlyD family secretion protein
MAAVAVVVVLLGLAGRGQTPDVTVAAVTRQTLETWITSNGKVEPIHPYVLRARLDTFVQSVAVVEGEVVKRGQLLLQLDTTDAAAQLAEARQNLLAAQRDLQNAQAGGPPDQVAQLTSDLTKTEATRDRLAALHVSLEKLVAQKAATRDELAENQLKLSQAEAELRYLQQKKQELQRQARFQMSQARLRIDQAQAKIRDLSEKVASARLVAPAAGTVYALPVKAGDYMHVGDELVAVADLHRVRVRAYVDEVDLGSLGAGQEVEIRWDGLPGRVWTGRTEVIPKQVVPYRDRRVGEVLCSVGSSDMRLLPSTNVDVQIRVDRLEKRAVKVGIASTERFEIREGVKEGERVAVPGATNLKDGLEIHPVEGR